MRRLSCFFALCLAVAIALAPALAEARAGQGSSFGSRGSMTYSSPPSTNTSPYGAQPFQQSTTAPYSSSYGNSGYGGYGYRSGWRSGLLGGLIGFGLGRALFGWGGFGVFGLFWLLIKLAILFYIVRWVFRAFTGPRVVSEPAFFAGSGPAPAYGLGPAPAPALLPRAAVTIGQADYAAFEVLLRNVQAAWSNNDLNALRQFASPEMVGYFAEQLAANTSRNVRNIVSDVHLVQGDLAEAWQEGDRIYATVAMRFSMIDATYDPSGRLVDGSATEHVTSTEYWTFLKTPGGHWILSAIQQAR